MASEIMPCISILYFELEFFPLLLIKSIKAIMIEISKNNLKNIRAVSFCVIFNAMSSTMQNVAIDATLQYSFAVSRMTFINCDSLLNPRIACFYLQLKAHIRSFWGIFSMVLVLIDFFYFALHCISF